jgi:glyoxylase-like metal-dependent hydrolase (beta-lactamase superfamily II)
VNRQAGDAASFERLGVHRIETPTPFPQVPTVNAWLIEGDELTLVDTGSAFRPAWEAFQKRLSEIGYRVQDIRRILFTHGHHDHAGLAPAIVKRSDAKVFIHEGDRPKVLSVSQARLERVWDRYAAYYRTLAMPDDFIEYMHQISITAFRLGQSLDAVEMLNDGDRIDVGDLALEVVACPGHTPGSVCFHLLDHQVLISGDHLLQQISPNPVMELGHGATAEAPWEGKFKSLIAYIASLERARALDLDVVLPGHGDPFGDHRRLIDRLDRFHQTRQHQVLKALGGGETTVYALARQLFPELEEMELFLSVSEMVGHLEVLEAGGRVRREQDGGGRLHFQRIEA